MDKQPEALRLADAICDYARYGHESEATAQRRRHQAHKEAASELRRLHYESEMHASAYQVACVELRKQEVRNAELLEALRFYFAPALDGYGAPLGAAELSDNATKEQ